MSKEARRGIAAAIAVAHAPAPTRPGRTTVAINGSVYQDMGGVGVAFQHRFAGTSIPVYFSGAYGNGGGRSVLNLIQSPQPGNDATLIDSIEFPTVALS